MNQLARLLVAALTCLNMGAFIKPALADWNWPYAQMTCVPQLGYFALRTGRMWNAEPNLGNSAESSEIAERSGLYGLDWLLKKPYVCSLGSNTIKSVWREPNPSERARGECATWFGGDYVLKLNDTDLMRVDAGWCNRGLRHDIELHVSGPSRLSPYSDAQDCTYFRYDGYESLDEVAECHMIAIKPSQVVTENPYTHRSDSLQ